MRGGSGTASPTSSWASACVSKSYGDDAALNFYSIFSIHCLSSEYTIEKQMHTS